METKTHYRKVFKSDHLGVADLEEMIEEKRSLIFTIKEVRQELNVMVAGRMGNHNIAYFTDKKVKPWVVNPKNSKQIIKFNNGSSFVEDWGNTIVELYIDPSVTFGNEKTGGIRIKSVQPPTKKPELTPDSPNWDKAKEAVKSGSASKESISKNYIISARNYALLCG